VILVDTSVWIDYFRGIDNAPAAKLAAGPHPAAFFGLEDGTPAVGKPLGERS